MKVNLNLGDTQLIMAECQKQKLSTAQTAYVLATAYHETAHKMKPVREMGGEKYLKSKKYYPFVGMGYVQLTWKDNYKKAGDKLGVDFVADPKKLLLAEHATPILVTGMREGWFTGKKLSDYLNETKQDFVNARRIINGTDRAKDIAAIAEAYEQALLDAKTVAKPEPAVEIKVPVTVPDPAVVKEPVQTEVVVTTQPPPPKPESNRNKLLTGLAAVVAAMPLLAKCFGG